MGLYSSVARPLLGWLSSEEDSTVLGTVMAILGYAPDVGVIGLALSLAYSRGGASFRHPGSHVHGEFRLSARSTASCVQEVMEAERKTHPWRPRIRCP